MTGTSVACSGHLLGIPSNALSLTCLLFQPLWSIQYSVGANILHAGTTWKYHSCVPLISCQCFSVTCLVARDAQPRNFGGMSPYWGSSLTNGDGRQCINVSLFLLHREDSDIPFTWLLKLSPGIKHPVACSSEQHDDKSCFFLTPCLTPPDLTPIPWNPIKHFHSSLCFRLCVLGKWG